MYSCAGVDENVFTEPLSKSTEITYNSSCFGSGSISLSVQTDKDVYRWRESILITAQVNNQSNKTIRAIRANIQRIWIKPQYTSKVSIDSFTDCSILRLSRISRSFEWDWNLRVPEVTGSHEGNGSKLSYCLQVTLIVSFAKNVLVELPFTIIPREPVDRQARAARRDVHYESRGVQLETTRAHPTSMPGPMMTAAQPETYTSWRHDNPPSCGYSNSPSCDDDD